MEGSRVRRAARRGAPAVLVLLGAGIALAVHPPAASRSSSAATVRQEALERARLEHRLGAAGDSVRLLRGLEAHLAERRVDP